MIITFEIPVKPIYLNDEEDGFETEAYDYEPTDKEMNVAIAECYADDNNISLGKAYETIMTDPSYFEEMCNQTDLKDILATNCYDNAFKEYLEGKYYD